MTDDEVIEILRHIRKYESNHRRREALALAIDALGNGGGGRVTEACDTAHWILAGMQRDSGYSREDIDRVQGMADFLNASRKLKD